MEKYFYNSNDSLYDYIHYLTFIDEDDHLLCIGRFQYSNLVKEYIKIFEINKKNLQKKELRLYINDKLSDTINSSIVHNFTMNKVGPNNYIANAGRDRWLDTSMYNTNHDGGMYFFKGYRDNDTFYFSQHSLGITIKTGAKQTHPASNECFTPIISYINKYLIYSRYNIERGKRLVQIFSSPDGLNNWKLYNIVKIIDENNNLLKNTHYSIYLMTVCKFKDKYVSLLRFCKKSYGGETYHPLYTLYYAVSNDGITFKFQKKIGEIHFWPCYGYILENDKLNLFFYSAENGRNKNKKTIGKVIVDNDFNIKIINNFLHF